MQENYCKNFFRHLGVKRSVFYSACQDHPTYSTQSAWSCALPVLRWKLLIGSWLLANVFIGHAQSTFSLTTTAVSTIGQIIPPAPKTAALGTFGHLPVDLNTGAVALSIPLVQVQSGALQVPVALRYNTTGVKVSELPSWVGQGWNLSAAGVITRTVRGQPDETPHKGYQAVWPRWRQADLLSAANVPHSGKHRLDIQAYNEQWDLEADTYTVSVPGFSATIVYDAAGHYAINPVQGWQVLAGGPTAGGQWLLVSPEGTRYHFGGGVGEEMTHTEDASGLVQDFATAWHLTAIESADGQDHIEFDYTSDGQAVKVNLPQLYQVKFEPVGAVLPGPNTTVCTNCLSDPPSAGNLGQSYQTVTAIWQYTYSLYQIRSATQRVIFDSDLLPQHVGPGQFPTESPRRILRRVRLLGQAASTPIHTFQFQFRYDGGNNAPGDSLSGRHYLLAVQEVGKPPTRFTYYESGNTANKIPLHTSFAQDHWGYYNGAVGNTSLIPQLPYVWRRQVPGGGNRATNPAALLAGSLSAVTYPTGGSTYFTYEANRALAPLLFDVDEPTLGEHVQKFSVAANGSANMDSVSQHVYDTLYPDGYHDIGKASVTAQLVYLPDGARSLHWVPYVYNPPHPGPPSNSTDPDSGPSGDTAPVPLLRFVRLNLSYPDPIAEALARTPIPGEPRYPRTASQDEPSELPAGTYLLLAACFDPNAGASLSVTLIPSLLPPGTGLVERIVGGLRIQRQVDYAGPSSPDSVVTTYDYTMPDPETGKAMTSGVLFDVPNYIANTPCGAVLITARDNTLLPKATEGGFHVGYGRVSVTRQRTTTGGTTTTTYLNTAEPLTRSLVQSETNRDGAGRLISEVQNTYDRQAGEGIASAKLQLERFNWRVIAPPGGGCTVIITDTLFNSPAYYFTPHYFPLLRSVTRQYEVTTGHYQETTMLNRYTLDVYGRQRVQPSEIAHVRAVGDTLLSWHRYVADYDTTGATRSQEAAARGLADLAAHAITAAPVEERHGHATAIGRQWLGGTFTDYRQLRPYQRWALTTAGPQPAATLPASTLVQGHLQRPAGYRPVLVFDRYSLRGELLQQHPVGGVPTSYLWGNHEPIAESTNMAYGSGAFTSFEPAASGTWRYDSVGTHRELGGRTGQWAYRLDGRGPISRSQLPVGDYELTYWQQGPGSVTLALSSGASQVGSATQLLASAPSNWQQYRVRLHFAAAGGQLQLVTSGAGSLLLDELRLYPVGARMTSYTYAPLVGMTSQTDPTGRIVLYEYDELGRLVRTRDEQGRILSQQQYHYAGK